MSAFKALLVGAGLFVGALVWPSKKKEGPSSSGGGGGQTEPGIDPDPIINATALAFALSYAVESDALGMSAKDVDWVDVWKTPEGKTVVDVFEPWLTRRLLLHDPVFVVGLPYKEADRAEQGAFGLSFVRVPGSLRVVADADWLRGASLRRARRGA